MTATATVTPIESDRAIARLGARDVTAKRESNFTVGTTEMEIMLQTNSGIDPTTTGIAILSMTATGIAMLSMTVTGIVLRGTSWTGTVIRSTGNAFRILPVTTTFENPTSPILVELAEYLYRGILESATTGIRFVVTRVVGAVRAFRWIAKTGYYS